MATTLTTEVIQAQIDKLYLAISNDELEVEDEDGNRIKYKTNNDILNAISALDKLLLKKSGRRPMGFKVSGGKGL